MPPPFLPGQQLWHGRSAAKTGSDGSERSRNDRSTTPERKQLGRTRYHIASMINSRVANASGNVPTDGAATWNVHEWDVK